MIYIARNYLHFAADSMGLCSLVLAQLYLIVEPSESKTTIAKMEFYRKTATQGHSIGHSLCNQLQGDKE